MLLTYCIFFFGAATATLGQTASILLPGFQGRELEASILSTVCEEMPKYWNLKLLINLFTIF
jgi:hypothetical protein